MRLPLLSVTALSAVAIYFCTVGAVAGAEPTTSDAKPAGVPAPKIPIPEILSMKLDFKADGTPKSVIPPRVFKSYDSRTIGENIVYRLHQELEAGKPLPDGAIPVDLMSNTTIGIRFTPWPPATLQSMIEKGILNQHQTGRSGGGAVAPQERDQAESALAAARFQSRYKEGDTQAVPHFSRPKYAAVHLDLDASVGKKMRSTAQYGSVIAILKEDVKLRTSLAFNDSLHPARSKSFPETRRSLVTTLFGSYVVPVDGLYLEAQIFGAVEMSDVAYFAVRESIPKDTRDKLVNGLKAIGIPIKGFKTEIKFDREHFVMGEVLFAGDLDKMQKLEAQREASRKSPNNTCGKQLKTISRGS